MLEKFKKLFEDKDKKNENLVFLLILLIITLFVMNNILNEENSSENENELINAELTSADEVSSSLEKRIENILSKIDGVGEVSVLLTYAEETLEGTVIVSEGAKSAEIKNRIITAVEAVTGLGQHKIQVYSMEN